MNKLIILLFLSTAYVSNAQVLLNGKIYNKSTKQPIEFLNVIISGSSLEDPKGALTKIDGSFEFTLTNGLYLLQVFSMGEEFVSKEMIQ